MRLLFSVFICLFYFTVSSQQTYVPDDNFEAYLETHDANGNVVAIGASNSMGDGIANNDSVNTANIYWVGTLNVSFQNIADLTGIEDFTNINSLNCSNNQLTNLVLKKDVEIILNCRKNLFTSLHFDSVWLLSSLIDSNSLLTSVDLSYSP